MSRLFECSTPERRKADETLPIIPSEIYLYIFEFLAPPTGQLTPEERVLFFNLTGVCRLFANVCLPRVFEFSVFSGAVFGDGTPDHSHSVLHGSPLYFQIAKETPLALTLAEKVRSCRLTDWPSALRNNAGSSPGLFLEKYLSGILKMKYVRELKFLWTIVTVEHWRTIASLESLEKLSFSRCGFIEVASDDPEKRVQVNVSHLQILQASWNHQRRDLPWETHFIGMTTIDAPYLRTFTMYLANRHPVYCFPRCALTELHLVFELPQYGTTTQYGSVPSEYVSQLWTVLACVPKSLEVLKLWLYPPIMSMTDVSSYTGMFYDSVWRDLPLLRSVTLQVMEWPQAAETRYELPAVINIPGDLKPFSKKLSLRFVYPSLQDILSQEHSFSSLRDVTFFGNVFQKVNGEWLEVL